MKLSWRDGVHSLLEVPAMTRLLSLPTGKRVLQIGCGSGAALPALARHCKPVSLTGIDISTDALSQAAGLLREMRVTACLVHADAQRMPFIDGSFDVVVDFGTCYQVADTAAVLQEIARILDTAGIFMRETPLALALAHPLWTLRQDGHRLTAGTSSQGKMLRCGGSAPSAKMRVQRGKGAWCATVPGTQLVREFQLGTCRLSPPALHGVIRASEQKE